MTDNRGIFTLRKIIEDIVPLDRWVDLQEVWVNSQDDSESLRFSDNLVSYNTGYFAFSASPVQNLQSNVDKVDFSTDTTSPAPTSANLSSDRNDGFAVGNSTHGYFAGGRYPTFSTVDKLEYVSDTTSPLPSTKLTSPRFAGGATGNSTHGYFGGGNDASSFSTMDKITYSSGTMLAVPNASLSLPNYYIAATGNSTHGYFSGGYNTNFLSTIDKVNYSTDTRESTPGASLLTSRIGLAATGTSTHGYFGGGNNSGTISSSIEKLSYSTNTTEALPSSADLSIARYIFGATGNSSQGYFGGGAPGTKSTMDKISYSTDTTAAVPNANLSSASYRNRALSGRANGLPQPFPTPTPQISDGPTPNTGYFSSGYSPSVPGRTSSTDKIDYSTDTVSPLPSTNLSVEKSGRASTGNSTAGYFGGGSPGPVSTMDKITYSTDTAVAVPGANLILPTFPGGPASFDGLRYNLAAVGNSTHGYFGGGSGFIGGEYSQVEKLTYSSETPTAVPGAFLSVGRQSLAATGNSTAGYFGGGSPGPRSTMDKLTYSSDTTAAVPGAFLTFQQGSSPTGRFGLSATGNSDAGYFGGGSGNSPTTVVEKLVYSSDTTSRIPGANLTVGRYANAATGNSSSGYFSGGISISSIDKTDYSTDTTTLIPGSNLSINRNSHSASSARANGLPTTTPSPVIV